MPAKVGEALSREWLDTWYSSVEQLHQDNGYLRSIPTACFWPFIDERQKSGWMEYIQSLISTRDRMGFVHKGIMEINGPIAREELDERGRQGDAVSKDARDR